MKVTVKLFASAADRIGKREITLDLTEGATVADLRETISSRYPLIREIMPVLVCAVNEEYQTGQARLHEGDEIALIPPVSGG